MECGGGLGRGVLLGDEGAHCVEEEGEVFGAFFLELAEEAHAVYHWKVGVEVLEVEGDEVVLFFEKFWKENG